MNKVLALNGGTLTNSSVGTTAILDNGIAAVALTGSQTGTFTGPQINTLTTGNGTGATFVAGTGSAPGSNGRPDIDAEVVTPGSGYTVAPTLSYVDTGTGTLSAGGVTAILSSLALTGNNAIGGNGNLVINAQISGAGGFSTIGTGTVTLTGSNAYAGITTVAQGNLTVRGVNTGVGAVNVTPGTVNGITNPGISTLAGNGTITGMVTTSASVGANVAHIAPGVNGSGANNNFDTGGKTLTVNGGLTIGNGTNLDFDLATGPTSSDVIVVAGTLSLGSGITLNVNALNALALNTPYTVINYGTSVLTGVANLSSWIEAGASPGGGGVATFINTGSSIVLDFVTNSSTMAITPTTISLGDVLQGSTPSGTSALLTNTGISSGTYATVATGSVGVSPASGTLAPSGTAGLTVSATEAINIASGNNVVIGTVGATNTSNNPGGNAPAVNVTANVFQVFSGSTPATTTGSGSAALSLTNLASTDGGSGQRAGVKLTGFSTNTTNFTVSSSGSVGIANTSNVTSTVGQVVAAATDLNGTYNYSGSVTGTTAYTDTALAAQGTPQTVLWGNVSVTAVTVSGNVSTGRGNIFTTQIQSGSSYAGYSLSMSVSTSAHPSTGSGGTTQATLSYGTASALAHVSMSFDTTPVNGIDNPFRVSDILTLTGINPTGITGPNPRVTLTDEYVLQLSYDTTAEGGLEYIAQNTGVIGGWVNAVLLNSTQTGVFFNGSYAQYLISLGGPNSPPVLGAYGYAGGVAWAVLDHTYFDDAPVSEFAVIPEPDTYAMIFSGFGMLVAFRRLRRRSKESGKV